MKRPQVVFVFSVLFPWNTVAMRNDTLIRKRSVIPSDMRNIQSPCRLVQVTKKYEHGATNEQVECELADKDLVGGEAFRMVQVKGLVQRFINQAAGYGKTMMFAPGAVLDVARNKLLIPAGSKVELTHIGSTITQSGQNSSPRRLAATFGRKEVLVLRESRSAYSEAVMSDEIFGTYGDLINLTSQYAACSYSQLTFSKWTGNDLVNEGVLTVSISTKIIRAEEPSIRDAMTNEAIAILGARLEDLVDHVMVCIPEGTRGTWIAYAYIDFWLSVYNGKWCHSPSAQLHELGHNFNMAHANDISDAATDSKEYGDQSGMMGYSYDEDETPRMCFNGPKTYQFGWFLKYHVDIPSDSNVAWSGNLIGFAEKNARGVTDEDRMIVRIRQDPSCEKNDYYCNGEDYYVHFNRAASFNAGTLEGKNRVLISKRSSGLNYQPSWLMSKLGEGEVYTVSDFQEQGIDLIISVNAIDNGIPRRAGVTIRIGEMAPDWTTCDDRIGLFNLGTTRKPCDWLRFRSQSRINSLCKDSTVAALCKETCGLCLDDCNDDIDVFFQIDKKVGDKNCKWVAEQQNRKDRYCNGDHRAFFVCRETCESCHGRYKAAPSMAPSEIVSNPLDDDECKDDDFWPFEYRFGKAKKDCAWLRRKPESVQATVCVEGETAYFACEATCGRCTRKPMMGSCNKNGVCEKGENCESCPDDCRVRHHATKGFCCIGGECGQRCSSNAGSAEQWNCMEFFGSSSDSADSERK